MLKKSRTINLIIISIYILTLVCGVGVFFSNTIIDKFRVYLSIGLPFLIVISSIIDIKKKFIVYKKDKFQLFLTITSLIWIIITIFYGIRIGFHNIKGFIHFFNILFLLLFISNMEIDNNSRYKIKKAILISSFICAAIGIAQYVLNYNLNTYENAKYPGILGRINSTFYIATLADKYYVLIIAILSYELLNSNSKFLSLHFILTSIAINLTFSRSAFLAFCFVLFTFFIFTLFKRKFRNLFLVVFVVIIMFQIPGTRHLIQHSADYVYEKMHVPQFLQINFVKKNLEKIIDINVIDPNCNNQIDEKPIENIIEEKCENEIIKEEQEKEQEMNEVEKDSSLIFRSYYNGIGKELFKENYLTGIGIGNYSYLYNTQSAINYLKNSDVIEPGLSYMYPHNGYIYLGAETGIIGLILINLCIIYLSLKCIVKTKKFYLSFVLISVFMLCSYTEGLIYNKQYIYIFIILYSFYTNYTIYSAKLYNSNDNKKKKIKFLCLHLGYGGIESATVNTANSLCNKYDITIASVYNLDKNITSTIDNKIKIKYLTNLSPNKEQFKKYLKNVNIFGIIKEGFKSIKILYLKKSKVIKEIINDDSDIIISTRMDFSKLLSYYGSNKSLKIACEHQHHNNNKKYINTIKYRYGNIDVLVALTNSLANDYKKFLRKTNTKVIVIPNMLNNDKVNTSKLNNNKIISVGRLHPGKCIKEAIDVFIDCNNDYNFDIVGDGEQYNELNNYIKEQKLEEKIKLLGRKNSNEINELLSKSDIFIMTSISEGLPMVLLEAMRCGVPAIAYETDSGVTDIIDDGVNGFIIKNRNHKEMVNKLNILINNKEMLLEMSKNALLKSRLYSAKNIEKKWIKLFEEINNE